MANNVTYYLILSARAKLARECSSSDYDLRRVLGHSNLLDCLSTDSVHVGFTGNIHSVPPEDTSIGKDEPAALRGHIRWADQINGTTADDWTPGADSEDSDSGDFDWTDPYSDLEGEDGNVRESESCADSEKVLQTWTSRIVGISLKLIPQRVFKHENTTTGTYRPPRLTERILRTLPFKFLFLTSQRIR